MTKMSNATKRILAAVLTMLLVFGMVPVSAIPVSAATTDYPEAVTVTVKDGGNPVSGAEVSFTITDSTDAEVKKGTVTTNANGSAEILAKAEYLDGLKINATVTKDGYENVEVSEAISGYDADITVTINTTKITDITVSKVSRTVEVNDALELVAGDAVIVNGLKEGDKVSYQLNGKNYDTMPQISKVGTYNVTVVVERTGYENFVATVVSEITEKKVEIDAQAIENLTYTGEAQTLVKINNEAELKDKYGVTLNYKTSNVGVKAQNYTVIIEGTSTVDGIVVEEKTLSAVIAPAAIKDEMITITPYNGIYDGAEHPAVTLVVNNGFEASVEYKLGDGEWTTVCPKIKDAEDYAIEVKIIPEDSENYKEKTNSCQASIARADREFKFANNAYNSGETTVYNAPVSSIDGGVIKIDKGYNFKAIAENETAEDIITYVFEKVGEQGEKKLNATFLDITEPGVYTVTATVKESKNYNEKHISHTINVRAVPKDKDGNRVAFIDFGKTDEINYYVNKNSNVISDVEAEPTVNDNSNVTYKILPAESGTYFAGIACDATTGTVYITDIDAFIAALNRAGGLLRVKVEATKSEGILTTSDKDSYIINIQYAYAEDSLFTLAMSITGTGWISSEVTVNPKEGYTVAKAEQQTDTTIISHEKIEVADDAEQIKTALDNAFTSSVKFGDDGQNKRTVYICDDEGYIYAPVDVKMNINGSMQDLKIDRTNPEAESMEIRYSTENNSIGDVIKTLFYKDEVKVTLKATDEMSGVQRFTCEYNGKEIPVENFTVLEDGKSATATATITITEGEEYKSKVSFKAYDRAGNATQKTGDETVIIDYVSPEMSVEYVNPVNVVPDSEATPKTYYFNEANDLVYKVKVKETNGFEENGVIRVLKEGKEFEDAQIEYTREGTEDVFTVTVPSTKDNEGVYTVEASYKDKSTNVMKVGETEVDVFVSDEMVIDTTAAAIEFAYAENTKHDNSKDTCEDYSVTLTVTEVNFDPVDFVATVEAKDIKGDDVAVDKLNDYIKYAANWTPDGDKHVCVLTYGKDGVLPDANYGNIKFEYTDLAKNASATDSGAFIIDTVAPATPIIAYEESLTTVIAEVLTLGLSDEIVYKFFNEPTTITLTSTDATWGVDSFVLEYNRQEGASETNVEAIIENVAATQSETDKDVFTAKITLPKNEADQLRGNVSAHAVDKHGIKSETVTDEGTVIVVDNITPEVSVTYAEPQNIQGDKSYYNKKIDAIITVNEANFLEDIVKLTVKKDGVALEDDAVPAIYWEAATDGDGNIVQDIYTGKFTIEGTEEHSTDGNYVVEISCTDKSTNKASTHQSGILVLDTTLPEIDFYYNENNKHDNSKDACEDYTVTLTVTEVNFDPADFTATVEAKDIKGDDVAVDKLNDYIKDAAKWTFDGDKHVCVLTYGKDGILPDANYGNIKYEYTDLAKNASATDSGAFIIDTTAPTAPVITYEDSLWPVIAEVLTLGLSDEIVYKYFNASTKITLTSTDATWGVDSFDLSYNREKGESKTNVEKLYIDDVTAIQSETDKDEFTAEIILSKEEADQLRGNVSAHAVDKHGIKSETVTDEGTVIVVDDIKPEVSVSYNKAVSDVDNKHYYKNDVIGTITVTEANFYAEDIDITVTRDGVEITDPVISWTGSVDADGDKTDAYTGIFTLPALADHSADGDYIVKLSYTDRSKNKATDYESDVLVIDTTAPVINVTYSNDDVKNILSDLYVEGAERKYFQGEQVATITITEHNFNKDAVEYPISEQDVTGTDLTKKTYSESEWKTIGDDTYTKEITYSGDANYTFDISYVDYADNRAAEYATDYFTVDKTAPEILESERKNAVKPITTIVNNITFGYFGEKAEIEVTAKDATSPVNIIDYTYTQTTGTSDVNKASEKGATKEINLLKDNDGYTGEAKATFVMPKGALKSGNNMHGDLKFVATDRANNESNGNVDGADLNGVIVDNIAPNVTISYSKAYATANGISYYSGDIVGTIKVKEANFDNSKDFNLAYTKDGGAKVELGKKLKWKATGNADEYVATFTLTQDGDYIISASYTDRSENKGIVKADVNKGTKYNYTSNQLTIDTKINAPVITFNGVASNGDSFSGDFTAGFKFEDDNYKSYQVTLTRTRYDEKNIDVKGEFIGNRVAINANGGSGSFKIPEERVNDGVYTLTVKMTDMLDHSSTTSRTFVVNRFGSVYVYNDALIEYISKGYIQSVDEDIIITEYNPNKLKDGSVDIFVKNEGDEVKDAITTTSPEQNNGWYEYKHIISKETFYEQGHYTITLSSNDDAGNKNPAEDKNPPMNTKFETAKNSKFNTIIDTISFYVDTDRPELEKFNVINADSKYRKDGKDEYIEVNSETAIVEFKVKDLIGIAKVEVIVDGESTTYEGETLGDDINNFVGEIKLAESKKQHEIIIRVTDLAGRVLDTSKKDEAKDDIIESYTDSVLVSTNFFVRFWNNKPVFWGVVGGTLGAAALVIILVALKKRKKKDEK